MSDTLARMAGIGPDDPDRAQIIPVLFDAHRAGQDLGVPEVVARCVIEGRYRASQQRARQAAQVVYYLRVGPLVKIGTTRNLERRLADYPPGSTLIAMEPGGRDLEGRRHRQFAHLLAGRREWFTPAADLLQHCDTLSPALDSESSR